MTQSSDSGFFWPWPLDVNEYSSMQFILILNSYYLYYKWYWVEPRPENSEPMEGAFTAVIWVPAGCLRIYSFCLFPAPIKAGNYKPGQQQID